ncbi:tetratricopeptide repeat protein [Kitasatospora sp. GAS1066B]|uniref:tetratricopeptide repeat protein n=1 Tax=Kitasatospora sp. GAS1066B TaxID=3156271 RepID=UPI00351745CB
MSGDGQSNRIHGGFFFGPVVQAHDVTLELPRQPYPALCALPAKSTAFTGRQTEYQALLAALNPARPAESPAVTAVSGLPGVGKTELAVQAAWYAVEQDGWFPGGVLFIDLLGYDSERRVSTEHALGTLLHALAVPAESIPPTADAQARLYASILTAHARAGRRLLVVIDNAAHAGHARPLLPTDGINAAVVTSRDTPAGLGARLLDLRVLDTDVAVDVLRRSVWEARGSQDARVDAGPEHAQEIAVLCEGLPLALRIVAAFLADRPDRPLSQLVGELRDAHGRLDGLDRDGLSVRAAIDLSYRQLDRTRARLFRLLAVHPGPEISAPVAAELIDAEQGVTSRLLAALGRSHLVEAGTSYDRWRMHDLVRLYAEERLLGEVEEDEREAAFTRLVRYYLTTTEAAEAWLSGTVASTAVFVDSGAALEWFERERSNLVALAAACVPYGLGVAFPLPLVKLLHRRRHFGDLLTVVNTALGDPNCLPDELAEATLLGHRGTALRELGLPDEAMAAQREALRLFRLHGDRHGESALLVNIGNALSCQQEDEEAIATLGQARAMAAELGDPQREALALDALGTSLRGVGRYAESAAAHSASVALQHDLGDRHGEVKALSNLAATKICEGNWDEAIALTKAAIEQFHASGDFYFEAGCLVNLAMALSSTDRCADAEEALTRALGLYRHIGDELREANTRTRLGHVLLRVGRTAEAVREARQAVELLAGSSSHRDLAAAQTLLGAGLCAEGDHEEAAAVLESAATAFATLGDRAGRLDVLLHLIHLARVDGRNTEVIVLLRELVALATELRSTERRALGLSMLGSELHHRGAYAEASATLEQAVTVHRSLDDDEATADALDSLGAALAESGQLEEAMTPLEEAVALRCRSGTPDEPISGPAARSLMLLGTVLAEQGRFREAAGVFGDAAAACRGTDPAGEGHARTYLGLALAGLGSFTEAAVEHATAVECYGQIDDTQAMVGALTNLANAQLADGNPEEAGRAFAMADIFAAQVGLW